MLKRFFFTLPLYALFAWSFAPSLLAQEIPPSPEHVSSFSSDITVNADGTLMVTETIKLMVATQINHEIYRDFSTRYSDRFGNPYSIHMEVISLERGNRPVDFYLRKLPNGLRIHMGNSRKLLFSGEQAYELTYGVDRAIGFFTDHDELYWNVTGDGWILPVQEASATVHLPGGIAREAILLDAYTGRQGSAETDYTAAADDQSNATFRTTRILGPHEGLTVVVRWPKGFVRLPTDDQEHRYFLEDYQAELIGFLGLIIVLIYYAGAWFVAGRSSAPGKTPWAPPRRFSPAALRYAWSRSFDQKMLVANLVDLAIKKQLAILEDPSGAFILGRLNPEPQSAGVPPGSPEGPPLEITADEKLILETLFRTTDTIRLQPGQGALVGRPLEALHHYLHGKLEKVNFMRNLRYLVPGLLLSLATVVRSGFAIQGGQRIIVLGASIGLIPWSLGCLILGGLAMAAMRNAFSDPDHAPTARRQAMVMGAICLSFLLVEVAGLGILAWAASSGVAVVLLLLAAINYLAYIVLSAPARSGGALLEEIEGFRVFLTSLGQDRRDVRVSPQYAAAWAERYLPYAMALNVEKVWGEKFAALLAQTARGGTINYSPTWYSGPGWNPITAATFPTSLGSAFSSAISSSTTHRGSRPGGKGSSA